MLNDINPYWKKRIIIGLAIILAFFIFCLFSCSVAKKDQAAINRVNANADLQTPVVNQWLKAHPIDTTKKIVTIPGEVIKVPVPVFIRDTARERKIKDSLINATPDCLEAVKKAYDLAYDEAEQYYKEHPVTVRCPPSTKETIVDDFNTRRWQDSAAKKDREIGRLQGQNDALHETIKEKGNTIAKKDWLIAALFLVLGVSVFFNVKSLISANKVISLIKKP